MIQTDKLVALYKHKINKLFTNKLAWITAVKFLSSMKQLVAQVTVALVVEQGVLIIAVVFVLCQLCQYILLNATQTVMNYALCTVVQCKCAVFFIFRISLSKP